MDNIINVGKEKIMVVGDLHFSDVYKGKHKDYFLNCVNCVKDIDNAIKNLGITRLILTGDLVGLHEFNLKHRDSLLWLIMIVKNWEKMTGNPIVSVKGNHDSNKNTTDWEMLLSLGYIENPDYVDIGNVRMHIINYGEERREITLNEDMTNIAVMHNDIRTEEVNWYIAGNSYLDLASLINLKGIELIICGHIHNPSPRVVYSNIDGEDIGLIYPGNPTRPSKNNTWESVFFITIATSKDDEDAEFSTVVQKLAPLSDLLVDTFEDIEEEELETAHAFSLEEMGNILSELADFCIGGEGDYRNQIERVAGIDKDASELAIDYIAKAEYALK